KLQRKVALTNVIVGFQLLDPGCVDDLALVDNRRVARNAKAKMHVLLGDQGQPLAGLVKERQRGISHQSASNGQHLLFARLPSRDPVVQRLQQGKQGIMRRIDRSSSPLGPFLAPITRLSSTVRSGK